MVSDLNPGDENVTLLPETSEGGDESTDLSQKSLPEKKMPPKNENFVPQMNAKSLRAFSRAGKRKNEVTTSATTTVPVNTTSNTVIVDGDNEVSSTTLSDQLITKRSRTNPETKTMPATDTAPSTELIPCSSTHPSSGTTIVPQWWQWFQGYEGKPGTEVTSIFDRRFSSEQVIKDHLCKPDDRIRIGKVGLINTTKMVQTFCAQGAFLGHALETGVGMLEKEIKDKHQKMNDLASELAREKKANEDLRKVGDDLKSLRDKFESLSLEKEKIEADFNSLKKAKDDVDLVKNQQVESLRLAEEALAKEKEDHQRDIHNLKIEIAFQYEQGFDKAVEQVKFLYPDLKLEEVGAYKVLEDGKLVEPLEDDE
ncbi:hypothetical protein SESBI_29641 [Sesbania bispinosa]|nr:hypothetical protein SESBI_29641 [Sesbania bispinosa]